MKMRQKRVSMTMGLCAIGLLGCVAVGTADRVTKEVTFSGFYNDITGQLSDGTEFTGKGWFQPGTTRGDFCLQSADMVCSGKYNATLTRRISGEMVCSNGLTGNYLTERLPKGDFVVPVNATGSLSDGRTATAVFSEIRQGRVSTTCFVPQVGG